MLLFIGNAAAGSSWPTNSNTSHVIVYQVVPDTTAQIFWHSNTSHVIVYRLQTLIFQISMVDSNTSHVIVYHSSASNLCIIRIIQIHLMLLFILHAFQKFIQNPSFKYISCYCLSDFVRRSWGARRHSNTSHVIVYRRRLVIAKNAVKHSNTSHVIVYLHIVCRK